MVRLRTVLVASLVLLVGCTGSPGGSKDGGAGDGGGGGAPANRAFALTNASFPRLGDLLSHTGIDGVALQLRWGDYETADGTYDWSGLDAVLAKVKTAGKLATLHFLAAIHPPSWLAGAGAQMYTFQDRAGNSVTQPVPWDSVYLGRFADFISAMAAHLKSTGELGAVFDVSVAAPTSEMNLIGCQQGTLGSSIPYDRAKYLKAWKTMIDAFETAFPNKAKFISMPQGGLICRPAVDKAFYGEVMTYAKSKGNHFWMFAADLTANGSQRESDYTSLVGTFPLGFQTIWSATNDPSHRMKGTFPSNLEQATCTAMADGATYLEIYAADVLNTDATIQKGISVIHDPSGCSP